MESDRERDPDWTIPAAKRYPFDEVTGSRLAWTDRGIDWAHLSSRRLVAPYAVVASDVQIGAHDDIIRDERPLGVRGLDPTGESWGEALF